jgi:hypothetical protein
MMLAGISYNHTDKRTETIGQEGIQKMMDILKLDMSDLLIGYLYYVMQAKSSSELGKVELRNLLNHSRSRDLN